MCMIGSQKKKKFPIKIEIVDFFWFMKTFFGREKKKLFVVYIYIMNKDEDVQI